MPDAEQPVSTEPEEKPAAVKKKVSYDGSEIIDADNLAPAEGSSEGPVDLIASGIANSGIRNVSSMDEDMLCSTVKVKGEFTIEQLARKIENRRNDRIEVTFQIRKIFLKTCREIAREEGLKNKIPVERLIALRDEFKKLVEDRSNVMKDKSQGFRKAFGFWNKEAVLLSIFERGVENAAQIDSKWFFFRDFNFYQTVIARKVNFFGNAALAATFWLLLFYFGSAILFCVIMGDNKACPKDPNNSYEGWLTAVYFASVTMSTVGYGDVNLSGGTRGTDFIATVYMLVALLVGYTVFATAAELALGGFDIEASGKITSFLLRPCMKKHDPLHTPLHKQVRRIAKLRLFELIALFFILNLGGMFVARLFIRATDVEAQDWSWMTTLYWAVQTTTTIGYGDLDMPFQLRWFQIIFTTLGTAFVGSVFGGVASLKADIMDLRLFYAWKRREVSKRLIEDLKGQDSDDHIDQFEFMVGSLLMLNKIETTDVEQIMNKFRELAGNKGYIVYDDAAEKAEQTEAAVVEGTVEVEDQDMLDA